MKHLVNVASGDGKSGPHVRYRTREKKGNSLGNPPKKGVWALSNCVKIQTVNSSGTMLLAIPVSALPEHLYVLLCCYDIWLWSSRFMSDTGLYSPWHRHCHYVICVPSQVYFCKQFCALCKHLPITGDTCSMIWGHRIEKDIIGSLSAVPRI